jgi:hypothetical protein
MKEIASNASTAALQKTSLLITVVQNQREVKPSLQTALPLVDPAIRAKAAVTGSRG